MSGPEQDHFHKETRAPRESAKLPLKCPQPGFRPAPLSVCPLFLPPIGSPRKAAHGSMKWLNNKIEGKNHVINRQYSKLP